MKIKLEQLSEMAGNFLNVLDERHISSNRYLERNLDESFPVKNDKNSIVSVTLRPSNYGTMAYTISYITPGLGVPIEVKVNKLLYYVQMILKAERLLKEKGYHPFFIDSFDNVIQNKILVTAGLKLARGELEELAKLKQR